MQMPSSAGCSGSPEVVTSVDIRIRIEQSSIDDGFTVPGKGGMGGSESDVLSASAGGSLPGDRSLVRNSSAMAAGVSAFLRFELSLPLFEIITSN